MIEFLSNYVDESLIYAFILFASFIISLSIGLPISVGIALSSVITLMFVINPNQALQISASKMYSNLDSFTLLAIPLFVFSGNLMNKGGIAIRLVNFAKLIGGGLPGTLLHTNVLANMLFGSISGSSIAAAAAVGGIMSPLQEKEGYDKPISTAVNIASAPSGILIPPSGPLILYSLVSGGASVAALFIAGYIPGILMGLSISVIAYIYAKKRNFPINNRPPFNEAIKITISALPPLFMVIIVIGGIIAGVFTATEGAAVAVLYSFILSIIYKLTTLKDYKSILIDSTAMSASILFLIAASGIMSYTMAYTGIPDAISEFVLSLNNRILILLVINILLLIIGTFMDLTPAVLIFTPIFLPIATSLGISEIHFGIILIFNLAIGNMTPPVGSVLFVGCAVSKISIEKVAKPLMPFFLILVVDLMLVTYVPAISTFLPHLFGLI